MGIFESLCNAAWDDGRRLGASVDWLADPLGALGTPHVHQIYAQGRVSRRRPMRSEMLNTMQRQCLFERILAIGAFAV